jgi:Tannase and feruloyl esterase
MKTRLLWALACVVAATIGLMAAILPAAATDATCSGLIGGQSTLTTIDGNVVVPNGKYCTLSFVAVTGNIRVAPNATLIVSARSEPSTIGGNIEATNCDSVLLDGNVEVGGNLLINSCNGSSPSGFRGPDVLIKGNFECKANAGPCVAWLGSIGGNAHVGNNRSKASSEISLVSVLGNLNCVNNSPAPTHQHGPDWVDGQAQNQCAGFSTTTTSIATPTTPKQCAQLATLPASDFPVPNVAITSAVDTAATTGLPERCIVIGTVNQHISLVDNCQYVIGFQVQLPMPAAWNGRFMFQGGGGTEGTTPTATGVTSLNSTFGIVNGYAVASQNGGHFNADLALPSCDTGYGNVNEFFLDPLAAIGQGFQSIEVTTLVAKYLVNQFFGVGPHHSYWVGCSTGGRQGMVMSQKFPMFFDGIVAGDPVYDQEALGLSETNGVEQILKVYTSNPALAQPPAMLPQHAPAPPGPIIYPAFPVADQALLESALLQKCDALDGVADGVIDNLPACNAVFDPATATYTSGALVLPLQCAGAKNATCLSPAQIQAVKKTNIGPRTSSGQVIAAPAGAVAKDHVSNIAQGYAWDGGWMTTVGIPSRKIGSPTTVPGDFSLGVGTFGYAFLSPPDPTFYQLSFNFDTDLGMLSKSTPLVTYSTSANIDRFVNYGHKIIWYHGLSDPGPPVLGTTLYYNEMVQRYGGLQVAQNFSRYYQVPNMGHCGGGATTDKFDLLTPIADWVEKAIPPGPVTASGSNFTPAAYQVNFVQGPASRSRPLCPYPQQARFTGNVVTSGGIPVATNQADLADPTKYECVTAGP